MIWRKVKGYPYEVSMDGRVRRLLKEGTREMNPWDNGNGYLKVKLCKNGKYHLKFVHTLVAEAFLRKRKDGEVINHKDYDKKNNFVGNLEFVTPKENVIHSIEHMRVPKFGRDTNTGFHHISLNKKGYYKVSFKEKGVHTGKSFHTLDEAIDFRNRIYDENKGHLK